MQEFFGTKLCKARPLKLLLGSDTPNHLLRGKFLKGLGSVHFPDFRISIVVDFCLPSPGRQLNIQLVLLSLGT